VDDVDEWSLLSAPLQNPVDIRHVVGSHLWTREALVADGEYPQVAIGERVLLLGIRVIRSSLVNATQPA